MTNLGLIANLHKDVASWFIRVNVCSTCGLFLFYLNELYNATCYKMFTRRRKQKKLQTYLCFNRARGQQVHENLKPT